MESTPCDIEVTVDPEIWCYANPDLGPVSAAKTGPVLTGLESEDPGRALHPVMARLIEEFGDRDGVWEAAGRNIYTFLGPGARQSTMSVTEALCPRS